jgi:hypothetical protein
MLIKDMRVPVDDGKGNVIMIRGKMDFATQARVLDSSIGIDAGKGTPEFSFFRGRTALLEHNILDWSGPDFIDPDTGLAYPCTAENIRRLDPGEPLVAKVLDELDRRNKTTPGPKPTAGGEGG